MNDMLGETILILCLCAIAFTAGIWVQKHRYREACGDILVSYTEGYQDCKAGK